MNSSDSNPPIPAFRNAIRFEPACSYQAVRQAVRAARTWLAEQGLSQAEVDVWELVLAEACNNAVEHAPEGARTLSIGLDLSCGEFDAEAQVTDHTKGFEFSANAEIPDVENEGSRGLFLVKTLTDQTEYWQSPGRNVLFLRKKRYLPSPTHGPDALELQRRLAESETALTDMAEELSTSYESLVAMFRHSRELGTATELRDYTQRLLADLAQLTGADAVVLRLFDADGALSVFLTLPEDMAASLGSLPSGTAAPSVEAEAARTGEDTWFDAGRPLDPGDPLAGKPVIKQGLTHAFGTSEQRLGTATIARRVFGTPFRSGEINLLHTFLEFLAIQIVNGRIMEERAQARVTRRELEIGASIQRSLLPVSLPACPPFEVIASCVSAREVGGDFYDAIAVPGAGVLLVIADVMGKGVPAALFSSMVRSTVRSMPALFTAPAALVAAVNRALCDDLARVEMFVTLRVVFLDTTHARAVSSGAGHGPPLVWRPGKHASEPLDDTGLPLGLDALSMYTESTLELPPGSVALLYTDGLTESRDPSGLMLGEENLAQWLPRYANPALSAQEVSRSLLAELERFRADVALTDDQTFLLLRNVL